MDREVPEHGFKSWWREFLADWKRRYPGVVPPEEDQARRSFADAAPARLRPANRISGSWERVRHPRETELLKRPPAPRQ